MLKLLLNVATMSVALMPEGKQPTNEKQAFRIAHKILVTLIVCHQRQKLLSIFVALIDVVSRLSLKSTAKRDNK